MQRVANDAGIYLASNERFQAAVGFPVLDRLRNAVTMFPNEDGRPDGWIEAIEDSEGRIAVSGIGAEAGWRGAALISPAHPPDHTHPLGAFPFEA